MRSETHPMRCLLIALTVLYAAANPSSADTVRYFHLDGLGNVRAITNQAGTVVERHDYLPFGEEWCPGPPPGVCSSPPPGQPRRFTGKERDVETGLDYIGARYYGSKIGRFTTVDPVFNWRENLADPQRWNRYAYGRNNPLRYIDPDGRDVFTQYEVFQAAGQYQSGEITFEQYQAHVSAIGASGVVGIALIAPDPTDAWIGAVLGRVLGGARLGKWLGAADDAVPGPSEPYKRMKHYGKTPTEVDRRALGAGPDEVVDHQPPLVKRFYDGDPNCCEKAGHAMSSAERKASAGDRSRMRVQKRSDSNKQGGEMSKYSKEKKKEHFDQ